MLKFFIQQKGAELFHAIPDLVKDSLLALQLCDVPRAKSGVLKALVALTKHHPKLVCAEMLQQSLPYDEHLVEYWHLVCNDPELTGLMLDNFLQLLSGACLYEPSDGTSTAATSDRQRLASVPPFAIFCALHEMMPCKDIHDVSSQTHQAKCATLTPRSLAAIGVTFCGHVHHAAYLALQLHQSGCTHAHGCALWQSNTAGQIVE